MLLPLSTTCISTLVYSLVFHVAKAVPAPTNLSLTQQLELASTQAERIGILASQGGNKSFEFDFNVRSSNPNGSVVTAVCSSFPALIGLDSAIFKFSLGPCGLIVPHLHPRSDEFIVVTEGTLSTQFIAEAGTAVYTADQLTKYKSTIFPKGSIHYEHNPTCEPTVFLGNFNSNDPGTTLVGPAFFSLDESILLAQLDGVITGPQITAVEHALPPDIVWSVNKCLRKCKLPKTNTTIKQIHSQFMERTAI